jgi:hypothetical protein
MVKVEVFTKGKVEGNNEDYFLYSDSCFVVVDGATDKSGRKYDGKTGGELVSRLVADECIATDMNGIDLVSHLNGKVSEMYKSLGIEKEISDAKMRFTCGFICVRLTGQQVIVTYLGDLGFRINGKDVYQEKKQVDEDNANERLRYILETGDIEGSRAHILPQIIKQFEFQNNPDHPLGFGVIDGTSTPDKYVKVFEYDIGNVNLIELFSDGYFAVPKGNSIDEWEHSWATVEREDPYKYIKYKSTKTTDDRLIMRVQFD